MAIGKIPPHDPEAEQAVLGSMLTDQDAVLDAIEILKPEDFYREDNKYIYEAMFNLYNKAEPIDIITVKSELASMGKFENIGVTINKCIVSQYSKNESVYYEKNFINL